MTTTRAAAPVGAFVSGGMRRRAGGGPGDLVAQSCLTLVTPRTVACQAPLFMGFPRQEYWSRLPFPPSGDLPDPGIKPRSPALQADFLPSEPPGTPIYFVGVCTHLHIYTHTKHIDSHESKSSLAVRVHVLLLDFCSYVDGIHIIVVVCVAS